MRIGSYRVEAIEAEQFRLDGGAMFGVVPKPLWSRGHPADEKNRVQMVTRCLLARGEGRVVLLDTGLGDLWPEKEREIYAIENGPRSIVQGLASKGVTADQVTDVVLTHLHFDHTGGGVTRGEGGLTATFRNARHWVQESQLSWAAGPTDRDRRSYRDDTWRPLQQEGRFVPVRGAAEILPGIRVEPTEGHTIGHQVVLIGEGRGSLLYCGDLIPFAAHLAAPWGMALDLFPVTTMKEKRALLARAADGEWTLVMDHDPFDSAVRVAREGESFRSAGPVGMD